MGVIVPEGFAQASFVFNVQGKVEDVVWTLGFVPGIGEQWATAAEGIRAAWSGTQRPFSAANMSNQWRFSGVRISITEGGEPVMMESMIGVQGTNNLPPVPVNCAFLVRKLTSRGGRKGRGRAYWPPVFQAEENIDATGNFTPGFTASMAPFIQGALTDMEQNVGPPVLFHADGSAPDPITSMVLQNRIATQRRRLR